MEIFNLSFFLSIVELWHRVSEERANGVDHRRLDLPLGGDLLGVEWDLPQVEFLQVQLQLRLININADKIAVRVVVRHNAVGKLLGVHAGLRGKINVERVGVWEIFYFHSFFR